MTGRKGGGKKQERGGQRKEMERTKEGKGEDRGRKGGGKRKERRQEEGKEEARGRKRGGRRIKEGNGQMMCD